MIFVDAFLVFGMRMLAFSSVFESLAETSVLPGAADAIISCGCMGLSGASTNGPKTSLIPHDIIALVFEHVVAMLQQMFVATFWIIWFQITVASEEVSGLWVSFHLLSEQQLQQFEIGHVSRFHFTEMRCKHCAI